VPVLGAFFRLMMFIITLSILSTFGSSNFGDKSMKSRDFDYFDKKYKLAYSRNSEGYDKVRFDDIRGSYSKRIKNDTITEIIKTKGLISKAIRVIDIASGTGRIAHKLLEEKLEKVFVSDISYSMLRVGIQKLAKEQKKSK